MKHPITDLFSVDAIYETLASFDVSAMSMHFDRRYLISEDPAILLRENPDSLITAINVPTPVLAHEICHMWQIAATPAGLRDFSGLFNAEFAVRDVLTEAARIAGGRLPVGLHHLLDRGDIVSSLRSAHEQALATYSYIAFRNGGLRISANLLNKVGSSEYFKDCHFFTTREDTALQTCTLLGVRHIQEGIAATIESLRLSDERELTPNDIPSFDPYLVCYQIYRDRRLEARSQKAGAALELAVILDTALMMDEWMVGNPSKSTPAHSFFLLLDLLADSPGLELNERSPEKIAEFQDALLSSIGVGIPSVSAICSSLFDYVPSLVEELCNLSAFPQGLIKMYGESIKFLLSVRLKLLGGASPVGFLAYAPRKNLEWILRAAPVTTTAFIPPLTDDARGSDSEELFNFQAATHLRPVVEETIFGRRPCPVMDRCLLPHRPACRGITQQIAPVGERCPRECVISSVLSDLQIDELIFD